MTKKHLELVYAYTEKGHLVHISDVPNGLKCNCLCKYCGKRLVAKNNPNNVKKLHFAHYDKTNCTGNPETLLHLKAKEIISTNKNIFLPGVSFKVKEPIDFIVLKKYPSDIIVLEKDGTHSVKSAKTEVYIQDIKPDILLELDGEKLIVEIFVTHKVNKEKLKKIKNIDVSAIEIDLSKCSRLFSEKELIEAIYNRNNIKWLFNRRLVQFNKKYSQLKNTLIEIYGNCEIEFEIAVGSKKFIIRECPKIISGNLNQAFVDPLQECPRCRYYMGLVPGKASIICSGKHQASVDKAIINFYDSL